MQYLKMPQEIEVWYIIPAIRRELAKVLVNEKKFSQREVSKLLGLTEAAVSQYLKSKRAKEITFDEATLQEIRKSSDAILYSKNKTIQIIAEMEKVCNLATVKHLMCDLHKTMNPELHDCDVCIKATIPIAIH